MTIWSVQLVFDCADPDAVARFWGRALEYRNDLPWASDEEIAAFRKAYPQYDGRGRVDDRELRRPPIYIQRVPEPKVGRNRIRLEIAVPQGTSSVVADQLAALGGVAVDDDLADVEGNEFSVTEDATLSERRLRSVVLDCLDPDRMLSFWSQATGYPATNGRCDPGGSGLTFDGGAFVFQGSRYLHVTGMEARPAGPELFDLTPGLAFVATDEPKQGKNRLHLDLNSTDADTERDRLVELGATVLRWDTDHVMSDPEGNEFCLSPSRPAD